MRVPQRGTGVEETAKPSVVDLPLRISQLDFSHQFNDSRDARTWIVFVTVSTFSAQLFGFALSRLIWHAIALLVDSNSHSAVASPAAEQRLAGDLDWF